MISTKDFTFDCGEMVIVDGKAKANPDKGSIRFYTNDDGIVLMEWKNKTKGTTKEPLAIVAGDWTWKKIGSQKGRVFMLQNTSFTDEKYLYWLQCPRDKDDSIVNTVNTILSTGLIIEESIHQEQKMEVDNKEENVPMSNAEVVNQDNKTNNSTNQQPGQMNDFIKNFAESIKKFQKKFPELKHILTISNVKSLISSLDKNDLDRLIALLPENQKTSQGLHDNISSPQFLQGLDSLTYALNSENLPAIISSFGLDMDEANKYANGVEAFIKCIIKKYKKDN